MSGAARERLIEEMCRAFVNNDTGFFFGPFTWPESDDDDGSREGNGIVKLMPQDDRDIVRSMMGFALDEAIEASAAIAENPDRTGRSWAPESLWGNIAREQGAAIRSLKARRQ